MGGNFFYIIFMLKHYFSLILAASLFSGCVAIGIYDEDAIVKGKRYWEDGNGNSGNGNGNRGEEGEFIDERDGETYRQVTIGRQTWMAENLRYETSNTKCYDNDPYNCEIFGILYDWNTANIICPDGWHLPNDDEWIALANFVEKESGCSRCAGTKLKANSNFWVSGRGTDDWGFTALPGGYVRDYSFLEKGTVAAFWSKTAGTEYGSAHSRYFKNINSTLNLVGFYTDGSWAYIRCLKD